MAHVAQVIYAFCLAHSNALGTMATVLFIAIWDDVMAKKPAWRANSIIQWFGNGLEKYGLERFPVARQIVGAMKTPPPTTTSPGSIADADMPKSGIPPRLPVIFAAIGTIGIGVLYTLALSGCGTTALDRYTSTLSAIERADVAALDAFVSFDKDYQTQIETEDKAAGHPERVAADLNAYRAKRVHLVGVQLTLSALIRGANATLPLIQAKKASLADLDRLLQQVVAASAELQAGLQALTGAGNAPPQVPKPSSAYRLRLEVVS